MTVVLDVLVAVLLISGGFFTAGTIGIVRFPDLRGRLHALTKADNLGLVAEIHTLSMELDPAEQWVKLQWRVQQAFQIPRITHPTEA